MISSGVAVASRVVGVGSALRVLGRAGVLRPYSPLTLATLAKVVHRWGTGPAGGFAALAARSPHQVGLIDDLGELTWGELQRRSNSLARALAERGVGENDSVALMCRNHRGFVDASIAAAKLGADILYLNTSFAGPELVDVVEREAPRVLIHDEEFTAVLAGADVEWRMLAWSEGVADLERIEDLIHAHDESDLEPPRRHSRVVILTSGTTGTPKGAPRREAGIDAAVALLSRMPLQSGWRTHVAAPLFHTWGFAHLALAMLLGSTVVLRRQFDPQGALQIVQDLQCESLIAIPVMLQRMLALDPDFLGHLRLDQLEVVASSGSAMPANLASTWMDRFGDNLYNIYGSTEVAYASIATPQDLRVDSTTAGKPPHGTVVKVLDDNGGEMVVGEIGRIFVRNGMLFEGYTGGGSKEMIDGLMSSGDLGRFDEDGRLHVLGRDDDMIVSGGENVFPQEIEDCLVVHDKVREVAVVGMPDDFYGQRLRAFVVSNGEASEEELKAHVKASLARFKVPREVVFVEELPRNATGKILRRQLVEWDREGVI